MLLLVIVFFHADNPKTFTACGHHFHVPCLFEWIERKDTCPICESKLQFEGLDI
ncbi:hypothetical protein DUNSADRAFT_7254 [Dunaliella salina]|uniref:RING-type E3 ubiquitin transferase n=1 Tax=Dunaliella salina TaxID=3046 RepID=A0ABQ7FTF6_DUNSA|nr:hypothetical protein DUNSADRAFT_7254 [Dunaliella salina]|eukprot:KAF5825738.1 hypothetical protein DUNSADRAFT_7254 [Dunaliella salina]